MTLELSRIKALCFDLDGTLNDTDDQFVERSLPFFKAVRFLLPAQDANRAARRFVMWAEEPANILMGIPDKFGFDGELAKLTDWINRKQRSLVRHYRPIPAVQELIPLLAEHYPLSVVSARDEASTRDFLVQAGIEKYFVCVAGALTVSHTKPFPDPILWAARKMEVEPANCLMVGDTTIDICAGKAAGAQTVGVLCGFGEEKELRQIGANLVLETTSMLGELLL